MKLIVGLGNPGVEYRDTYHNVGFNAADLLASRLSAVAFLPDRRSNSLLTDAIVARDKVLICKPQTYMNLSGDAVSELARYFKIPTENILVVYDDIDIAKGTVRARTDGSAGTHNGMRDIVCKLGSSSFPRVRVGTGFRPPYMGLAEYVLSHFPQSERGLMADACALACDFVEEWLRGEKWGDLTRTVKSK
ncbi:MAG: aminoacyl-tRNA hydrolase [Clostridia bacterium]|nr:aminoacyl-tRNA hydrolase [Clostridia bacterium]